jgi:EpsI family protein
MLRVVGVSVLLEGNIIDIGIKRLEVADACSGLRYFMPMILMALLVAYFFVKGKWRWTVLLFLIVPLSVFINAVRIWMSALLNANGHPELAENLFHDFSGWLMFMIAGAFLVAVALVLKRIGKRCADGGQRLEVEPAAVGGLRLEVGGKGSEVEPAAVGGLRLEVGGKGSEVEPAAVGGLRLEVGGKQSCADEGWRLVADASRMEARGRRLEEEIGVLPQTSNLKPDATEGVTPQTSSEAILKPNANQPGGWLKPALITVVLCLLFTVSGWALKQIPSSGNLPQRTSFEHFPMNIGDWQGKREYISEEILKGLWADDYVTARYFKPGSPNMMYLLIPFYAYQATNHAAHAPQACILGGGFSLVRSKAYLIRVAPDREIEIMTMILEKGDTRLLGSYFFLQKGRVITSPWMNKYYLIWDGIFRQRTDGALVRAEMTVAPGQSMEAAYAELEGFIVNLWPILPKYIPE